MRFLCVLQIVLATYSSVQGGLFESHRKKYPATVNHVIQEGLEHPNDHIHGFVLTDVFLHHATKTTTVGADDTRVQHTLTQRKLQFNKHPHLQRHLSTGTSAKEDVDLSEYDMFQDMEAELDSLDASGDLSRAKVRALAKLQFINAQWEGIESYYFSEDVLAEVDDPLNDLYFNTSSRTEMYDLTVDIWKAAQMELDAVANSIGASSKQYDTPSNINTDTGLSVGRHEIGVCSLLFQRGSDTILVFRDTVTAGDNSNVNAFVTSSIVDKESELGATKMMKKNWENAGLEWGEDQKQREAESDWYIRSIFPTLTNLVLMRGFGESLTDAVNGQKVGGDGEEIVLTLDEAKEQGYWPVTKAVIEQVRTDLPEDSRILFSGYSQGGSNAQLARMYTEKKYGETWPVVTFAAVGAACFPRDLSGWDMTDYLDDVDPTKYYENVTDYQLFFDFYGAAVGQDIGKSCNLGGYDLQSGNLMNSRQYRYCKDSFGWSSARLIGDEQLMLEPVRTRSKLCRYVTHGIVWIMEELAKDEELNDDGSTYAGCDSYKGEALDGGMCPAEDTGIVSFILTVLSFLPAAIVVLFRHLTQLIATVFPPW